jgi:metal-responsive CopG/Arc/MetJ family transcriptional regulator
LPEELTAAIDKWAAASGVPSRSEAIRRLTELGLKVARLKTPLTAEAATRARELVLRTLDKLEDKSAPEEERANRRQRLLKGPKGLR